jgi:hypothetical protein
MNPVDDEFESKLRAAVAADVANSMPPESGHVWRSAQLRARREAIRNAGRPITAIQVMATGCAFGLLGACFGATSAWFQMTLRGVTTRLGTVDANLLLSAATAFMTTHMPLLAVSLALLLLIPGAVYVALVRD